MKTIKYTIAPTSPWAISMRSDTLHGQIVCAVREWEGEKACKDLLQSFMDNEPAYTCSSAFPENFLPIPVLAPISRPKFREAFENKNGLKLIDWLQEYKTFKKKQYIPLAVWQKNKDNLNGISLFSSFVQEKDAWSTPEQHAMLESHNSINRETGRHLDGSFYGTNYNYSASPLDVYVQAKDHDFFEKHFTLIGEYGFGGDSTLGKGRFKITARQDVSLFFADKGEYRLNLSVLSAESLAGIEGHYKCFTKKGKIWTAKSTLSPFKKPFIAIEEGAVIKNIPSHCLLQNINADKDIMQLCHALFMPCNLK